MCKHHLPTSADDTQLHVHILNPLSFEAANLQLQSSLLMNADKTLTDVIGEWSGYILRVVCLDLLMTRVSIAQTAPQLTLPPPLVEDGKTYKRRLMIF